MLLVPGDAFEHLGGGREDAEMADEHHLALVQRQHYRPLRYEPV